ncbi:imidazolonepropionase-like amidohydrolase [Rhodothalassium salexigens DSM 2132]|uniref:Imidazolonepropionase-like amidohydrolase n=1 Tax=Rhodothalassium salexigens DSM 2132 TaxID=1188247 RepID=A0A4R2PF17_RHOSA|nr:amidohydrolase [Rhodothalassium salexigens]MBB4212314.1 imidazolonepropionase-like amidohydrolase [Rhodothalassium salexigens DSM 2132]MBK1638814.1 amidohydrolase [Rhodothalassium salexigens DSM 2132]TCP32535.1 imidazolonepropionase-like amidohydrolase [Rhodothalassium salexigens DSM 2132]
MTIVRPSVALTARRPARSLAAATVALLLAGCATTGAPPPEADAPATPATPAASDTSEPPAASTAFPSTYEPLAHPATVLRNATVFDGTGRRFDDADVLMIDGKVAGVGRDLAIPAGTAEIDASGKWVTPGIVDNHSHLGVYPSPSVRAHADGNEATAPNTAQVWAEHSVWPQDPGFVRALAGGVTALQVLPGSANLFGGRSVTLKPVPARSVQEMKFPGAPYGLKMACGENPKRVYGSRGRQPSTRMGSFASYRAAWIDAQAYRDKWDAYERKRAAGEDAEPPKRDLKLETLKGVLDGEILVHMHCYRADEMLQVLDMAQEFDYRITAFHHAIEAYKIADRLAEANVCASVWADWWGFKMEAYDTVPTNAALVHAAGGCAIIHSDSDMGIQRLNQEAAKVLGDAERMGLAVEPAEAWTWLSLNPARSMGIDHVTGSLEAGKNADVVVWSADPFSVYAKAEKVYVDGALAWDLDNPAHRPITDFELGQPGEGDLK